MLIERGRLTSPIGDAPRTSGSALEAAHFGYRGDLDTFGVSPNQPDAPTVILKRHGFAGWKVARIELPKSLFQTTTSAPTPDAAEPSPPTAPAAPPVQVAEPASPLPPPAEPTPATITSADAIGVATKYLASWSNPEDPNGAGIKPFYAEAVTFYGRPMSIDDVMAEKQAFARRWPRRSYIARPASINVQCDGPTSCTVSDILDWRASHDTAGRLSTGVASFNMHLRDGLIDQESGRVLARQ